MYLSYLLIDVGDNPDRPRPGRLWLRNLYRVHQRLCMAFPSASRKSCDPEFLKRYKPEDFGGEPRQVRVVRQPEAGFLYRIDPQPGSSAVILVQSALKPDWDYAFHNAQYLLSAPPEVKSYDPNFSTGERLQFRLVANPTKRFSRNSQERDGQPVETKWVGKRIPVPAGKLYEWISKQGEKRGFSTEKESVNVQPGYIYFNNPNKKETEKKEQKGRLRSVRYDGILTITDPGLFMETLISGLGSGKAFGFGLLSVALVKS